MQKHRENMRKYSIGGVGIFVLVVLLLAQPAAAQITPPTPLPQVIATQQAASQAGAQVGNLQAQRANVEAQLAEINRNIEAQIAAATQAAADARTAAATQNAVEAGAAIGRLEGAIAQLKDSYAGKDSIISDTTARVEQLAAQSAEQQRTIDALTLQLQQAQTAKKTALDAYNALSETKKQNQQNDMVSNAIWLIVALAFLLAMITLAAFVIQRRRAVVVETPPAEPPLDGEYRVSDEEQQQL